MTRLILDNISIVREQRLLIDNFTHTFNDGEIYALVGDNGCGKTTLLKTIAGLRACSSGSIIINGKNSTPIGHQERAINISFLLQHSPEQPYCTVIQRIAHGLIPVLGYDLVIDEYVLNEIQNIAQRLSIAHLLHRKLTDLSGGEQRLVYLAKCLLNPKKTIILLDEPTVYLDTKQKNNLANNLIQEKMAGKLILFSSHDLHFIHMIADYTLAIENGFILVHKLAQAKPSHPSNLEKVISPELV